MHNDLERVFDFDEADILLNQNNQLSGKQSKLVSEYARINKLGGRISFFVMFISMSLLIVIPLYAVGIDYLKKYPEMAYGFIAVFLIGWLLYISSYVRGKRRSDIKSRRISVVEGFPAHKIKKVRQWNAYYLIIDEVKFQVESTAKYKAIKPDVCYRIFYIKYSPTHIILSIAEIPAER